jgi:HK97 family phage portal protein
VKLLGLEISVRKAAPLTGSSPSPYYYDRGWFPVVQEPYAGAWQRNDPLIWQNPLQNSTLYRCVAMPAADVAKMRLKLMQPEDEVWKETTVNAFSPVLNKPNRFQTRIQFYESWIISKLRAGNAYVLKERDQRNVVVAMYVLDPAHVKPLVAPDGSVFYELNHDNYLAGIQNVERRTVVPADEIIHDRINCLFHPLVGMSPLYSTSAPAARGLAIQEFSASFFNNAARPSGLLTAPGNIDEPTIARLQNDWKNNYTGVNQGRVAVLGSGLTFNPMQQNAVDSQLIEQLKHTDETICTSFGIPAFMVGVKDPPNYNNAELLDLQYYKQCLQSLIEHVELLLSEGLGLIDAGYRAEFDLTGLFRMDSQTQITVLAEAVMKGILSPNEARRVLGYPDVTGGESPMAQQQQFTLEALANRANAPALPAAPAPAATPSAPAPPLNQRALVAAIRRHLDHAA